MSAPGLRAEYHARRVAYQRHIADSNARQEAAMAEMCRQGQRLHGRRGCCRKVVDHSRNLGRVPGAALPRGSAGLGQPRAGLAEAGPRHPPRAGQAHRGLFGGIGHQLPALAVVAVPDVSGLPATHSNHHVRASHGPKQSATTPAMSSQ